MVNAAAQTEVARDSAAALVRAYMGLRGELLTSLESDETRELREEFERLFVPLEEPEPFETGHGERDRAARLAAAAADGRTRLGQLGGWIQGLIDELTFQE